MFPREVLVDLLDVGVNAEGDAVHHHSDEVGLGCWHVLRCDVRKQNLPHDRVVAVGIEQIEGSKTVDPKIVVECIDRDTERLLDGHVEGCVASVRDADLAELLAVEGDDCRDLDVGSMEGDHFVMPVGGCKVQEDRVQDVGVIQAGPGQSRHFLEICSVDPERLWVGFRTSLFVLASAHPGRSASTTTRGSTGDFFSCEVSFGSIQLPILIRVELFMQKHILKSWSTAILWCREYQRGDAA